MSLVFYLGDTGPVSATVTDIDGITPITPLSATANIINLHTGTQVVTSGVCQIGSGIAAYIIPDASPVTQAIGRYVAYITVEIDSTTKNTVAVPFDVLDKASYLVVDRWRRRVEFSAPDADAISDEEGRDWVDQAVAYLRREFGFGYTSVLATITPDGGVAATSSAEFELIAKVASLMARTAWWAGKGSWRDEELSFDASPFRFEWEALKADIGDNFTDGWFIDPSVTEQWNMRNRDNINRLGLPQDKDYYYNEDRSWWYSDQL